SRSRRTSIAATLLAGALGWVGCSSDVRHSGNGIAGGIPDPGDPAVVGLLDGGKIMCTGTLIAPTTVLTAAHCLILVNPSAVLFGWDLGGGEQIGVLVSIAPPSYVLGPPKHDRGLIRLRKPVSVPPLSIRRHGFDATVVGAPLIVVGFGRQSA